VLLATEELIIGFYCLIAREIDATVGATDHWFDRRFDRITAMFGLRRPRNSRALPDEIDGGENGYKEEKLGHAQQ
jgi:hypothetical protein